MGGTDGEGDGDGVGDDDDNNASGGVVVTFANVDWEHGHELVMYGEDGFEFQYRGSEEWWPARISQVDGKGEVTVVAADREVGGSAVDEPPSAIRYAWRDNPCCTSDDFEASDCPSPGRGGLCSLYTKEAGLDGESDMPALAVYAELVDGRCVGGT